MGTVKPTQQENQVVDLSSDAHLWYMPTGADSPQWLYDHLFPMESESFQQMQQQRTIFNNNYPWYGIDFDIGNLKAMQEPPLQQQASTWGGSDSPSPNSRNYILSDSRDSSPCVSTNAPSESDVHRINMGDNRQGFRDEFKALPLHEQRLRLDSEVDMSRRNELAEILLANVTRIGAAVFEDPDTTEASTDVSKLEEARPRGGQGVQKEQNHSNDREQPRDQEADAGKRASKRGVLPAEEMPFSCNLCGVGCRDKTSLRKHMYVHQPRRYFCDFEGCKIGFHTKRDLRRHTDTKHRKLTTGVIGSRVRRKSFICKIDKCERGRAKPFSRRDNARQHVVGVHGIKNTLGEAEKVIEEIDIDIDGDTIAEVAEESNPSTAQRAEPKQPPEASIKPTATDRAPCSGHKAARSKESEDVLAEFTNLQEGRQEGRQDNSVTKSNSSGQTMPATRKKPSASGPANAGAPAESGLPSAQTESDEQSKVLQQQQPTTPYPLDFSSSGLSSSLLALSQPDASGADIDRAMDIWEQMAKAQANGTAPPIDPSSLFDIDMSFAKMTL
ncbi:hypothetical protein TWF730_001833 [Orbilia blumenaviensis]|uniref:C2H2-type domain-containing protein n=1 Tax=Orbilia blumenaviensis TaxID=1796055 RepID=A0AAV9UDM4_9PEZI